MDEADKILISQVKRIADITVQSLDQFESVQFMQCTVKCFDYVKKVLEPSEGNFIDPEFFKRQNFTQATHRYKIC